MLEGVTPGGSSVDLGEAQRAQLWDDLDAKSWGWFNWQLERQVMANEDNRSVIPPSLRLFSVQQVAEILQVHEGAVRKLVSDGKIAGFRVGVFIRIPQTALERFLEDSRCTQPDARRQGRGSRKTGSDV